MSYTRKEEHFIEAEKCFLMFKLHLAQNTATGIGRRKRSFSHTQERQTIMRDVYQAIIDRYPPNKNDAR
jgi:hypothetical protein